MLALYVCVCVYIREKRVDLQLNNKICEDWQNEPLTSECSPQVVLVCSTSIKSNHSYSTIFPTCRIHGNYIQVKLIQLKPYIINEFNYYK